MEEEDLNGTEKSRPTGEDKGRTRIGVRGREERVSSQAKVFYKQTYKIVSKFYYKQSYSTEEITKALIIKTNISLLIFIM